MAADLYMVRGGALVRRGRPSVTPPAATLAHDWSETNLPWAHAAGTRPWEQYLPAGTPVVDLSTTGATFWDRLNNTQNAQPGRFICRVPGGRHILDSFRLIGSSGDPSYAFGAWFPKLAGFMCDHGPANGSIEMAPNSMTQAQLDRLSQMTQASFAPNQMGMFRLDSQNQAPAYLGGLTFRAANQNPLTSISSDITGGVVVPQPAPHQGPTLYSDNIGLFNVSYCRFEGAGKAWMSQPPFEMGNVTSNRCRVFYDHTEFDGRLSSIFDPARPRKVGPIMLNKEYEGRLTDCWGHHSNVSRYAANDETVNNTDRTYSVTRTKFEQITNTQNDGLGGYTNASPFGWEASNARIDLTDVIASVDNPFTDRQTSCHLQLTSTGGHDPAGGRMYVVGGIWRNTGFPSIDGYLTIRMTASRWRTDGYDTTLDIRDTSGGPRKQAFVATTWPPTAAQLAAAGASPATHYIVRTS